MASYPDADPNSEPTPVPRSEVVSSSHVMSALLAGIEQLRDGAFLLECRARAAPGHRVAYVNPALCELLGRLPHELIERQLDELFPGVSARLPLGVRGRDAGGLCTELELASDSGPPRCFELSLHPVRNADDAVGHFLGLCRDLTAARERERARVEKERLVAVELLAAGLSHEVNNPLASITTNLEWLVMQLPGLIAHAAGKSASADAQAQISAALVDALVGAERIESTIRYLSMLSGLEDARRELLDVRVLLEAAVTELDGQLGADTTVVREYADVPPVMASEQRLKQAFVNLILNAAQAIAPNAERRAITLRVQGRARVRVEVRDSGTGVAPGVRDRLFSPFVTTKPPGIGKGLGLFLCRRILEAAGGSVGFSSEPGAGATFWVELPTATS